MARPKRVFSDEEKAKITQMSLDNCHFETIAMALDMSVVTLKRHYGRYIKQKRAEGRTILAHQQKERCEKGDTTMLIWRGKNDLGQTDKTEQIHGVTDALGSLMKEIGAKGVGLPIKDNAAKRLPQGEIIDLRAPVADNRSHVDSKVINS